MEEYLISHDKLAPVSLATHVVGSRVIHPQLNSITATSRIVARLSTLEIHMDPNAWSKRSSLRISTFLCKQAQIDM